MSDLETIIRTAIVRKDLDKLLLGSPEYHYRNRWSMSPGDSDVNELLDFLYHNLANWFNPAERTKLLDDLTAAICSVVGLYEGVYPVASCIVRESYSRVEKKPDLGLQLDDLAERLCKSVERFRARLENDRTDCRGMPDGALGWIRHFSGLSFKNGGPKFYVDLTSREPAVLVKNAIAKGELDRLLLGTPEYRYRRTYNPVPWLTDLTDLLSVMYEWSPEEKIRVLDDLIRAITSIIGIYEGLYPAAKCILLESAHRRDGRPLLDLPLNEIAAKLRCSVNKFRVQLARDRSGVGSEWQDGMLGELKRLNEVIMGEGGPAICADSI